VAPVAVVALRHLPDTSGVTLREQTDTIIEYGELVP
jgi:hypothetical protein